MSEIDRQDLNSNAVPFFARYLEGQFPEELSEEEMAALSGGMELPGSMTKKYPSDDEGDGGAVTTLRYPSDQEDDGGKIGAFPAIKMPDIFAKQVTMAYPSDSDTAE